MGGNQTDKKRQHMTNKKQHEGVPPSATGAVFIFKSGEVHYLRGDGEQAFYWIWVAKDHYGRKIREGVYNGVVDFWTASACLSTALIRLAEGEGLFPDWPGEKTSK